MVIYSALWHGVAMAHLLVGISHSACSRCILAVQLIVVLVARMSAGLIFLLTSMALAW